MDTRPLLFVFGVLAAAFMIVAYRAIGGRWPKWRNVALGYLIGAILFFLAFYGPTSCVG